MKKIMLISLVIACLWLVSCGEVHTGSTATTEATATTQATTTDSVTTVETTITTSTSETTISETVTTEPIAEPTEAFIEFDLNGRPIPSPDDKSCFELVTKKIKVADIKALIEQEVPLNQFCSLLSLQCLRIYYTDVGYDGLRDEYYVLPVKTDDGWKIIAFYCWDGDTIFNSGYLFPFEVEKEGSSSTELIESLKKDVSYEEIRKLGFEGTILHYSTTNLRYLQVLYVFTDGTAIEAKFESFSSNTEVEYNIFKL